MKKILSLLLVIVLTGCGGSGGGAVHSETPNVPNIDDELTAAEQLFGQGNGTGAEPTELLTGLDNANNEYLSFGAWGNVYDILSTQHGTNVIGPLGEMHYRWYHYYFTPQQTEAMAQWTDTVDNSLANATFRGPAVMNAFESDNPQGYNAQLPGDYGSVEIRFGIDVNNPIISFVMSQPENNVTLYDTSSIVGVSSDKNNIHIHHERNIPSRVYIDELGYYTYESPQLLIYEGYGVKQ